MNYLLAHKKSTTHDLKPQISLVESIFFFLHCCPKGNFSHGKFRSLSQRKASCCNSRTTQPQLIIKCMLGLFVSVIHQTLTWTTGSMTCVHDHSYACGYIYTGVGHTDNKSAQQFDSEKLTNFCVCSWRGSNIKVFGPGVRCSTNRATPSHFCRMSEEKQFISELPHSAWTFFDQQFLVSPKNIWT